MRKFLTLILILLLPSVAVGAAEKVVLENGLTVLLEPQRTAPAVSVGVFLRVGRIHEPPHLAGVSHFVEHMMYRATGRRPGGKSEREAWAAGAASYAFTHEDLTRYQVDVPSDRLPLAIDILSDSLLTARFLPEEIEEERRVILEEVNKRDADPSLFAWEEATGTMFRPHPYGERIIGSVETIRGITRDQVHGWFRTHYRPERAYLVIAGDFEAKKTLAMVRAAFGPWKSDAPLPSDPPKLPLSFGHYQEMVLVREGASPMLTLTAGMPAYLDPDYLPARFLKELMDGWLDRQITRAHPGILSSRIWFSPLLGRNMLRIRLSLRKGEDATMARDALLALLARMRAPDFQWGGVANVARNFRARELLVREDLPALVNVIGRAALNGYYEGKGPPEHLAAKSRYDRIDDSAVARMAGRYLRPANLRIVVLSPTPIELDPPRIGDTGPVHFSDHSAPARIPFDEVEEIGSGDSGRNEKVRTVRLANGLTFHHLDRHDLPLVGVSIAFPAGSRLDPEGKEGLAELTVRALERDTKDGQYGRIRWQIFNSGDDYRFWVHRDTAQLAFTVPREDLADTLEAVVTMIRSPTFADWAVDGARASLLTHARRNEEHIASFAKLAFRKAVLGKTPRYHSPVGTKESLARIGVEDAKAFHKKNLRFSEAVIAIVGDAEFDTTRQLLVDLTDGEKPRPKRDRFSEKLPGPAWPGLHRITHPSGRAYALTGTLGVKITSEHAAASEILRMAIGWQAFYELTENRSIAYEAGSTSAYSSRREPFGILVGCSAEALPEARKVLDGIVGDARTGRLPKILLSDARGAWLGGQARAVLRLRDVAYRLAGAGIRGLPLNRWERLADAVRRVTSKEINTLAARIFKKDRVVTVVVEPR